MATKRARKKSGGSSKRTERTKENLPQGAKTIFEKALKSAHDEYKDSGKRRGNTGYEETAHKVAWSAVKKKYEKGADGKWHRKSSSTD